MDRCTVILKCGKEFSFKASEVSVKYNTITGEVVSFSWISPEGKRLLYVAIGEIAAVFSETLQEE